MDNTCNMSFSGLKTAVKRETEKLITNQGGLYHVDVEDICASFQKKYRKFSNINYECYQIFNNNFKVIKI